MEVQSERVGPGVGSRTNVLDTRHAADFHANSGHLTPMSQRQHCNLRPDFGTIFKGFERPKSMNAPPADVTVRLTDIETRFVDLWGTMSSLWGINPTMARIH